MAESQYMKLALQLAEKGCGSVNPNPMVGAVIVKNGKIIGQGYHAYFGGPHAERAALEDCSESPAGATLYVTLEPCCHYGKQPPCTDAILKAGIRHVLVGSSDPNPLVSGKGIETLRKHGVTVTENVMRKECDQLNEVFFHYIKTGRPYVIMKYAMTMDGKIATKTGASKWITAETARLRVQQDRSRYAAIMVGVGTVLKDDPLLTCRLPERRSPVRIVCDTHLKTPLTSKLVRTADRYRTIIATCCEERSRWEPLTAAGCQLLLLPKSDGHTDLKALIHALGNEKLDSILLEGGGQLNWSALQSGIVNKIHAYVAPKLFGGSGAPSPIGGPGIDTPDAAFRLSTPKVTLLQQDILLESEVISCLPES